MSLLSATFRKPDDMLDLEQMRQITPRILMNSALLADLFTFFVRQNLHVINSDPKLLVNMKSNPAIFSSFTLPSPNSVDQFHKQFNTPQFIRNLIQLYFSYLPKAKPDQFADDSKVALLFVQEYDRRSKEMQLFGLSQMQWHNILLGAVGPGDIPAHALPCLFASGYIDSLPYLTTPQLINTACILCSKNGFIEGIRVLLTTDDENLNRALLEATENDNYTCIPEFPKQRLTWLTLHDALTIAIEKKFCLTACALFEKMRETSASLSIYIRSAIDHDETAIAISMLKLLKNKDSSRIHLFEIVTYCIDTKKSAELHTLLSTFYDEMGGFNFESAGIDFLENTNETTFKIAHTLLTFCGKYIPRDRLVQAKKTASCLNETLHKQKHIHESIKAANQARKDNLLKYSEIDHDGIKTLQHEINQHNKTIDSLNTKSTYLQSFIKDIDQVLFSTFLHPFTTAASLAASGFVFDLSALKLD